MIRLAWLCLVLAACTGSESERSGDLAAVSGNRLELEWWETADGFLQYRGIFDTALATECRFGPGSDGGTYCLPIEGSRSDAELVAATRRHAVGSTRFVSTYLEADDGLVLPIGVHDRATGVDASWDAAPAELVVVLGSDITRRLQAKYLTAPDGFCQIEVDVAPHDRALDVDCAFVGAGVAECLPAGPARPADQLETAVAVRD
jgi:hypothetical protein